MYVTTEIGGGVITEFVNPAPAPTHKTSGIDKSEWRTLYTPTEILRFRRLVKDIDGDLSWLPNASVLDDECGIEGYETLTWLEVLQIVVDEWQDARSINANDPRVIFSTTALGVVGVLDDMSRIPVLLQGLPL